MTETAKNLLELYRTMVTIRQFETMAGEHFMAGEIPGFIHLSIGQEASAVGVCSCLREDDYVTTTHRGHGHMIAKGADLKKMTAELFARKTGFCKGKGGSMHIADFSIGIMGANGVVAGGLPITAGVGFSIKMRKTDQVAVVFFGDGASNRGPVHEVMNMASIWKLPIIFIVENNQWASTTPQTHSASVVDLSVRAAGYNMPGVSIDGNDVLEVKKTAQKAIERARKGEGPTFIENKTYRIAGHFVGDPQKYRTKDDVKKWQEKNDPLDRFSTYLTQNKKSSKKNIKKIWEDVAVDLNDAVAFAKESPFPKPEEAMDDLFANDSTGGSPS